MTTFILIFIHFLLFLVYFQNCLCNKSPFSRLSRVLSRRAGNSRVLAENLPDEHIIASALPPNPRKLVGVRVNGDGILSHFEVPKEQLALELKLPLRDLRIIDPSYPNQIQATIVARPNVVLFSIDGIKIIIKHNEALIFNINHADVKSFIPALKQQVQLHRRSCDTASKLKGNEEEDEKAFHSRQRFEQLVVETALNLICTNLSSLVRSLEPSIATALLDLRAVSKGLDVIQTQVDELLPLKNKLDELRKRSVEIKRCILDLLHNDEDLEMMHLLPLNDSNDDTSQIPVIPKRKGSSVPSLPVRQGEIVVRSNRRFAHCDTAHQQSILAIELLLENYLNEVEWVTSEVDEILDEITNTEENVVLQLDLIRNRILKFELLLSIASFIVTCGALVTGLFGMNLLNRFELHKHMFYAVSGLLFSFMAIGFKFLVRFAKVRKLL